MRYIPMGLTHTYEVRTMRCTPMRCTPSKVHAHEVPVHETHTHEVYFFKRLLLGPWLDLDVEVSGPLVKPAVLF
jgi:hypothetical protein